MSRAARKAGMGGLVYHGTLAFIHLGSAFRINLHFTSFAALHDSIDGKFTSLFGSNNKFQIRFCSTGSSPCAFAKLPCRSINSASSSVCTNAPPTTSKANQAAIRRRNYTSNQKQPLAKRELPHQTLLRQANASKNAYFPRSKETHCKATHSLALLPNRLSTSPFHCFVIIMSKIISLVVHCCHVNCKYHRGRNACRNVWRCGLQVSYNAKANLKVGWIRLDCLLVSPDVSASDDFTHAVAHLGGCANHLSNLLGPLLAPLFVKLAR